MKKLTTLFLGLSVAVGFTNANIDPQADQDAFINYFERNRYNNLAGDYNIAIKKIPASIIANMGGFTEIALFKAESGAESAPEVNFNF